MNGVKHIHNVLKTLDQYPTYFVEADTTETPPYLVVNLVTLIPYSTKGEADSQAKSRVQVNLYGSSFTEIMEMENYVRNALENTLPGSGPTKHVKFRDVSTPIVINNNVKTFFAAMEFEVIHDLAQAGTTLTLEDVYNFGGDYLGQLLVITET